MKRRKPLPPPADASAARPQAQRYIGVHLTNFAPGLERIAMSDPQRWRLFAGKEPEPVVRATLKRLGRKPGEVQAWDGIDGDVELRGAPPDDLVPFLSCEPGDLVLLAIFYQGVTRPTLAGILASLRDRGWTPPKRYPTAKVVPLHPGQFMADPDEPVLEIL